MRERATANDVPFTPLDKLFEPTVPQGPELPAVDTLPVEDLRPFSGHPFHLYTDEKLRELTDSIREHGVLMPVLVRPLDGGYEIVSGHNRVEAAKLAGLDKVPITVRELDDDTATILMVDSNLRQRETLLPSEKAWAYRMKLEAIKRQGFRTDLTSAQVGQKLSRKFSRDLVAEEAGESKNQISRYIPLSGWACCRPRRNRRQKKAVGRRKTGSGPGRSVHHRGGVPDGPPVDDQGPRVHGSEPLQCRSVRRVSVRDRQPGPRPLFHDLVGRPPLPVHRHRLHAGVHLHRRCRGRGQRHGAPAA